MTRLAGAATMLLATAATALAQTARPDTFAVERRIVVTAPGPQRLDLDAAVLAGTQAVPSIEIRGPERRVVRQGPPDLRLYSEAGLEIPYLFVPPPLDAETPIAGAILPVAATKTASGFEVDFHEIVPSLDWVVLDGIPAPFLKRFRLEGSGDRVRWTVLVDEGTAFDLPAEGLRATTLRFAAGAYRYLRVTWDDTNSARVDPPRSAQALRHATAHTSPALRLPVEFERRNTDPGHSRFHLRLPGSRLPIDALELTIGGGHLLRDVRVLEARLSSDQRRSQVEPVTIGRARLTRVVRDGATADAMRIRIEPPSEPDLDLVFDDGDNPPLELQGVTAVFAELPWIYFESQPGTVVARYGNLEAGAPHYDLEAARTSIPPVLNRAVWGPEAPRRAEVPPSRGLPMPSRGAALALGDFQYTRTIPPGPEGLTVITLDAAAQAHSASGDGRFADVRVLDRDGRQVPYLLEKREEPLTLELRLERRDPSSGAGATAGASEYVVPVPYREIQDASLVLTTRARVFRRTVRIGVLPPPDRRGRTPALHSVELRLWEHEDDAVAAQPLILPVPSDPRGEVVLEIDEGDNLPLPLERATLLVPSYAVRFFRADAAPLLLAYGHHDLTAPRYDLALLAPHVLGARAHRAEAEPEQGAAAPQTGGQAAAQALVSPVAFWSLLVLSVVVLLGLVVRLVRRET